MLAAPRDLRAVPERGTAVTARSCRRLRSGCAPPTRASRGPSASSLRLRAPPEGSRAPAGVGRGDETLRNRRRSSEPAPAAREFARLHLRRGEDPAESVRQPITAFSRKDTGWLRPARSDPDPAIQAIDLLPKIVMAGRDPAMSVEEMRARRPRPVILPCRGRSGHRSSTTLRLPWPPPCPRRSAGSACPTAAPHWRRRSRGNRLR
jgi:hypothetical protein